MITEKKENREDRRPCYSDTLYHSVIQKNTDGALLISQLDKAVVIHSVT